MFHALAVPIIKHQAWKRESSLSPSRNGSIRETTAHWAHEEEVDVIDLAGLAHCLVYLSTTVSNEEGVTPALKLIERIAASDTRRNREVSPERQGVLVNQVPGLLETERFLSPFKKVYPHHFGLNPVTQQPVPVPTPTFMSVVNDFSRRLFSAEKGLLRLN